MRSLRLIVFAIATNLMVALSSFGRVKPLPIDADSILLHYLGK